MLCDTTMTVQDLPLIDPDHCFICGTGLPMFNTSPLMISEDRRGLLSFCEECNPVPEDKEQE